MLLQTLLVGLMWGAGGEDPATLGIFVDFENTPSMASIEAMQKELRTLLAPAGFTPAWRPLKLSNGTEGFDKIVIVRFKGVCNAGTRSESTSADMLASESVLARTKVSRGRVLPLAEVECDNVKRGVSRAPLKDRAISFGNVLGRVLAHELYHVLIQTVEHQRTGLARAIVNWNDLLSGQRSLTGIFSKNSH